MSPIIVTGAGGFLGRSIITEARKRRQPVIAIVRSIDQISSSWLSDPYISPRVLDLADGECEADLLAMLQTDGSLIHAAAALSGTDIDHQRDTLGATERLLRIMCAAQSMSVLRHRLVLVSSLSVYDYSAMAEHAILDESAPIEINPKDRDAYCRAKLGQENLAILASKCAGLEVRLMRVGSLYGPGRTWSARLGFRIGSWVLCPGGESPVPAIHVENCARALLEAATGSLEFDGASTESHRPHLDIINLVDGDLPTQRSWIRALPGCRAIVVPWSFIGLVGRVMRVVLTLLPIIRRVVPTVLLEPTLAARFKPLQYSNNMVERKLKLQCDRTFLEKLQEGNSLRLEQEAGLDQK